MSHDLQRTVGNDLVGIHVNGRACAALHHVGRELVVHLTVNDLAASLCDGGIDLVVDHTEFMVRLHCRQLDICHGNDVLREIGHLEVRDLVIVNTTLRLHAVVCFCRHLQFTEQIGFNTIVHSICDLIFDI